MHVTLTVTTSKEVQVQKCNENKMEATARKARAKLQAHKEFLYDIHSQAGDRGSHWMDVHGMDALVNKFERFTDPSALSGRISRWRRLNEWATMHGADPCEPRQLQVVKYIWSRV